MEDDKRLDLCKQLYEKNNMKINTYKKAEAFFSQLKKEAESFVSCFDKTHPNSVVNVNFESKQDKSFSLTFGSDVLFFMLHSNVFSFNRDHEVMKLTYIKENKNRAFCGIVNIYNFLSDSIFYNRYNDLGYLIGRVFINEENHYYVDGKKEVGQIYNNFANNKVSDDIIKTLLEAAIKYSIGFDLLVPPYEEVKEITVMDMIGIDNMRTPVKTAKRLGFRFQADM